MRNMNSRELSLSLIPARLLCGADCGTDLADGAGEAGWVPDLVRPGPAGGEADVPGGDTLPALHNTVEHYIPTLPSSYTHTFTVCWRVSGNRELLDSAATQGVSLPLSREQSQLFLLVFSQRVAIPAHQL